MARKETFKAKEKRMKELPEGYNPELLEIDNLARTACRNACPSVYAYPHNTSSSYEHSSTVVPLEREGTSAWGTIVVATNCTVGGVESFSDPYELVLCDDAAKLALLQFVCTAMGYNTEVAE